MLTPVRKIWRQDSLKMMMIFILACAPSYCIGMELVTDTKGPSERLKLLFKKTKILCFGRYAITVPIEAELISGGTSFPSKIEIIKGGIFEKNKKIESDIEQIKLNDPTSEIVYMELDQLMTVGKFDTLMESFPKKMGIYFSKPISPNEILHFHLEDQFQKVEQLQVLRQGRLPEQKACDCAT